MSDHPYKYLPDVAYWRSGVAHVEAGALNPIISHAFKINAHDKVAAAGSCFAQHIGRYLKASGWSYLMAEPAHPLLSPQAARITNYEVFSARYGNIYTARQLLQLFDRAYGGLTPSEDMWREDDGVFIDPFRPNIQPQGFNSAREFSIDRARHFRAVRDTFENLDVFIFTLGLTEAWRSKQDGVVFPVCPGVSGGQFSPMRHEFVNFSVDDVVCDMRHFIARLRSVNRKARIVLTVSPVPLAATAEKQHVLVSTTYSKAVLRVACETLVRSLENVAYFPSYEIVASGCAGPYFGPDKRSVTGEGVAHVMRVFAAHFLQETSNVSLTGIVRRAVEAFRGEPQRERPSDIDAVQAALQVMCDEEALDPLFEQGGDAPRPAVR